MTQWSAKGTAATTADISNIVPDPMPKNPDEQRQVADAHAVAIDLAGDSAGPFDVDLEGNGMDYPTSRVLVTVTAELGDVTGPAQSWTASGAVVSTGELSAKVLPVPTDNATGEAQYRDALAGAGVLVSSGAVGNVRPFSVHLSGDTGDGESSVTVLVHRPVKGYDNS
jgi:hypothetical protein